jgi:hypothetical protein
MRNLNKQANVYYFTYKATPLMKRTAKTIGPTFRQPITWIRIQGFGYIPAN